MAEMTDASKDHRNLMLISRCNDFIITHTSTWLNGAACPAIDDYI
jgi:hypothetical protein